MVQRPWRQPWKNHAYTDKPWASGRMQNDNCSQMECLPQACQALLLRMFFAGL
jgi:hypothetical protein